MNVRNEVRSHLVCEGVTMQDVLKNWNSSMDGAGAFPICQGSSIEKRCDIRKPWSWQMCWVTRLFGKRGGKCLW